MTRPITVEERVGQWAQAFDAVRRELTPDQLRAILDEMKTVEGIEQLGSYMSLARNVMANDRTAGVIAAMLIATGIKPTPVEIEEVP